MALLATAVLGAALGCVRVNSSSSWLAGATKETESEFPTLWSLKFGPVKQSDHFKVTVLYVFCIPNLKLNLLFSRTALLYL